MTFTLGTVLIGLILLVWELGNWLKTGLKRIIAAPQQAAGDLLPFTLSWCVGALAAMVVGGIVGWATDTVIWGGGWLGDAALIYGVGGQRQAAPANSAQPLTDGGLFMTALLLAFYFAMWKAGAAGSKKRGFFSGILLAMSAGVARVAAVPLASTANLSGAWLTGLMS